MKLSEAALAVSVLINVGLAIHLLRGPAPIAPPAAQPAATAATSATAPGVAPGLAERLRPIESQGKVLPSAYEQNEVRNTLTKRAAPPIQVCFRALTDKDPSIRKGKVEVDWQILPSGKTQSPEVVTSDLPQLDECVVKVLGGLEFPPPPTDRPVYVSHSFNFKAEEPAAPAPAPSGPAGPSRTPRPTDIF